MLAAGFDHNNLGVVAALNKALCLCDCLGGKRFGMVKNLVADLTFIQKFDRSGWYLHKRPPFAMPALVFLNVDLATSSGAVRTPRVFCLLGDFLSIDLDFFALGIAFSSLGKCTRDTPSLNAAEIFSSTVPSGRAKLRWKVP